MLPRYIPSDPLFNSQWHLLNEGQDIMGLPQADGAYRNDINVTQVWPEYTGKGVIVGVFDNGVQTEHPDLAPNLLTDKSYDTTLHKPGSPAGDHGTGVMGLILAAQNGQGVVGVAYDSKGISYTHLRDRPDGVLQTEAYLEVVPRMLLDGVAVNNNSWGYSDTGYNPFALAQRAPSISSAHLSLAQLGRGGLGTATLFSAGNGRGTKDNTLYDPLTNSPYTIAVAAANADGTVSSYSTAGPNVLVAAPGSGANLFGDAMQVPSIVTTDLLGTAGLNKSKDGDYTNLLDPVLNDKGKLDPKKSSVGFNGTSAAAPIATGVVALMLEANPLLGYRDIQEILAYSARTPDGVATWKTNGATDWNGGGHRFNDDLGFGLIDARAAVRLAETWSKQSTYGNLAEAHAEFAPFKFPPGGPINGATFAPDGTLSVAAGQTGVLTASFEQPLRVQHVSVTVAMRMDNTAVDLSGVTLTLAGPNGQTSTALMDPASYYDSPGDPTTEEPPYKAVLPKTLGYTFNSVQNWGELSNSGNWTLTVSNANATSSLQMGAIITLLGDAETSGQDFIYTDDYANLAASDPTRAVLSATTTGPHTLNAAAVSGNTVIDLAQHSATIAGVTTRISDSMQFAGIVTGDGNDQLSGTAAADTMTAGRGNDTLQGADGADTLSGGRGDDLVLGQDGDDLVLGGEGNDFGSGGWGRDTVRGEAGNDLLFGDDDDDLVDGGAGNDSVYGGTGNDTLFGSEGADWVSGEQGNDFIGAGSGNDTAQGGLGNDEVHGEDGDDLLFGDDGNDGVYGGNGNDTVSGGSGNDVLTGDAGNDQIAGDDGDDRLSGGDGSDYLSGGVGSDTLSGGNGVDLLFGNAGDDVLSGGAGSDIFAFGAGDGRDRILDFVLGGSEADVIAFNGGAFSNFAAVQAVSRQEGTDLVIAYGAGDAITLQNVQLTALSATNFTFA